MNLGNQIQTALDTTQEWRQATSGQLLLAALPGGVYGTIGRFWEVSGPSSGFTIIFADLRQFRFTFTKYWLDLHKKIKRDYCINLKRFEKRTCIILTYRTRTSQPPERQIALDSQYWSLVQIHGCLDYVARWRDCRIRTLSIKISVFVWKRESLKIQLIVCICSARFGDPNTSLEFLPWQWVLNKQPLEQNTVIIVIQVHAHCYILYSLSWSWNCFSQLPLYYHRHTWSKRVSHLSEHWFNQTMKSCERTTGNFFFAILLSKGYWYSLFDLDDTSFSL